MDGDLFSQWLVVGFVGSRFENRLDGLAEEPGNAESKRQAGIVFASFNGIHGLERKVLKSSPRHTLLSSNGNSLGNGFVCDDIRQNPAESKP
jgi:hypothetical protein